MSDLAKRIRDAILRDVTDRRGWRQEWDAFDEDVREDIRAAWLEIIEAELEAGAAP